MIYGHLESHTEIKAVETSLGLIPLPLILHYLHQSELPLKVLSCTGYPFGCSLSQVCACHPILQITEDLLH